MTIDTNILVAYLDGDKGVIDSIRSWRRAGATLILSTVVETELLSYSAYSPEDRRDVELFLEENFLSVSFDRTLARIAANIRSVHKIKFPDAAIAATALATQTPIVTRNIKDWRTSSSTPAPWPKPLRSAPRSTAVTRCGSSETSSP